jgi:ADP-ribose pyrophosphatase
MSQHVPEPLPEVQTRTERVYDGRVVNLRVDEVRLPDGKPARREVVEHRGAVAIVALLPDDRVMLVRQWRHCAGEALTEIPAGTLNDGEEPLVCARRELMEETGHAPGSLEPLVTFYSAPGFTTEKLYLFLARDLTPASAEQDEDEDVEAVRVPWQEALAMCLDGRIRDAKSIAGLLAAERVLNA